METSKYPKKTFRISNALKEDISRLAKKLEKSQSDTIRFSIKQTVDKYLGSESRKK